MKMKKLAAIILAAVRLLCTGVSSYAEESAQTQIPEDILRAKELSDRLSNQLRVILPDGSIVVGERADSESVYRTYAALDVRKIVSSYDIAMLTHGGELYQGGNRTAEGIADVVYCTNNVNVSGYALTEAGGVCYISDGVTPNVDGGNTNPDDKIVSIPDSEGHDFFYLTESGALLVHGGDQYVWLEPEYSAWTDLVHVAVAKYKPDSEPEAMTIVGIQKDGTVKVAGDYAEEILGWGRLSWVAGAEGMIIGVKEDGTLGITGETGKKVREDSRLAQWKDIVCVDVGNGCISAIDSSGNYYFAEFKYYDDELTCAVFSPDGYVRGGLDITRYYPDGTIRTAGNKTRTWDLYIEDEY